MQGVKITSIGCYHPEKKLTNADLEKMVDTSDKWITSRTGIKERYIASEEECTSSLALSAAKKAIENRGMSAEEIDLIIVTTLMPDQPTISVACTVQYLLGAKKACAFDISVACSGFVYAIETAAQFIKNGVFKNALIIGSELISKITDWEDRSTCVLFGDAAGAVILEASEADHFLGCTMKADGSGAEILNIPAGGTKQPPSVETVENRQHYIKMQGMQLFETVIPLVTDIIKTTCEKTNISLDEIELIIPHQANIHFINEFAFNLDVSTDKFMSNIHKFGNTSSASIPLALYGALKEGRIQNECYIMLVGFGGGLACAANIVKVDEALIKSVHSEE